MKNCKIACSAANDVQVPGSGGAVGTTKATVATSGTAGPVVTSGSGGDVGTGGTTIGTNGIGVTDNAGLTNSVNFVAALLSIVATTLYVVV